MSIPTKVRQRASSIAVSMVNDASRRERTFGAHVIRGWIRDAYLDGYEAGRAAVVGEILRTPSDTTVEKVRKLVGDILRRERWDDQGGYPSYDGNGKWGFVTTGLSATITPDEFNALFEFAGIVPDKIESIGSCDECGHARIYESGRQERGYEGPCLPCKRPRMSNFVPVESLAKCPTCDGTGKHSNKAARGDCNDCHGTGRVQTWKREKK